MTEPAAKDVEYSGKRASQVLRQEENCKCANTSLELVKQVLVATGYPPEKLHFIKGRVEDTVPALAPHSIAILRLDTDWYESTRHELTHLFPRLSKSGVIIIDDYGHWRGSRQACDEYFSEQRIPILLNRIDYTGRIGVRLWGSCSILRLRACLPSGMMRLNPFPATLYGIEIRVAALFRRRRCDQESRRRSSDGKMIRDYIKLSDLAEDMHLKWIISSEAADRSSLI
jgi:hypothetical protein